MMLVRSYFIIDTYRHTRHSEITPQLFGFSMLNEIFCPTFNGNKIVLQAAQKKIDVLLLLGVFIEYFYIFILFHNNCSDLYQLDCIKCNVHTDKLVKSLKWGNFPLLFNNLAKVTDQTVIKHSTCSRMNILIYLVND